MEFLQQHMQLHWSNLALTDAHTVLAVLLLQFTFAFLKVVFYHHFIAGEQV